MHCLNLFIHYLYLRIVVIVFCYYYQLSAISTYLTATKMLFGLSSTVLEFARVGAALFVLFMIANPLLFHSPVVDFKKTQTRTTTTWGLGGNVKRIKFKFFWAKYEGQRNSNFLQITEIWPI